MMTQEIVISPIYDEKINSHILDSEIWKEAYTLDDMSDEIRKKHPILYEYSIKFDGVMPIQVTKIRKI